MAIFNVVEKFVSINGEGTRAGQLAVFIRFAGCNLNCNYCDTAWANYKNVPAHAMTEFEIYDYVKATGIKNVTLTGGEPLLRQDIDKLLRILSSDRSIHVEIETNGTIDLREFCDINEELSFTVDYKLPGSGMEKYMLMSNFEGRRLWDTVKFVVSDEADLKRAKEIIEQYGLVEQCNVYISPVFGRIEPAQIVDYMKENKLNGVNLQLQMHKIIWDPERKGV
ncbi:MAG: putative 7-carboxy-7-deazaguanine synthase QueE [Lachnospiraceae bacterium]|nr:putative 7-carboxy-7-deazaguanine synthase QueE [Lachnospiraceae bacterium]